MPEKNATAGSFVAGRTDGRRDEAVCIHTKKIYDACRDKDCIEDIRVYLSCHEQEIVNRSINVKPKNAELIWTYIDVENVSFNRGFYTVDVKYFYKVECECFCGLRSPVTVCGLATFDKRCILFGSDGNAKIFSTQYNQNGENEYISRKANMPVAVVECVDPVCLSAKTIDKCHHHHNHCDNERPCGFEIPGIVGRCFENELIVGDVEKELVCTLGQFSIIRLERDTQLVVPVIDYCMPEKECGGDPGDNPCEVFRRIKFPVDEFFPPNARDLYKNEDFNHNHNDKCHSRCSDK